MIIIFLLFIFLIIIIQSDKENYCVDCDENREKFNDLIKETLIMSIYKVFPFCINWVSDTDECNKTDEMERRYADLKNRCISDVLDYNRITNEVYPNNECDVFVPCYRKNNDYYILKSECKIGSYNIDDVIYNVEETIKENYNMNVNGIADNLNVIIDKHLGTRTRKEIFEEMINRIKNIIDLELINEIYDELKKTQFKNVNGINAIGINDAKDIVQSILNRNENYQSLMRRFS